MTLPRPPTVPLLLVAAGVVIASFVGVTVFAQTRTRAIDRYAAIIAHESAPKIDELTTARGALHRASVLLRQALANGAANDERARLTAAGEQLREALGRYQALPVAPGEAGLLSDGSDAPDAYLRLGDRIMQRITAGDDAGAHRLALHLSAAFDDADDLLQRLVRLNADRARAAGDEIRTARWHAAALSYALDALAAILAVLLTLMVARAARAASHAADEQLRLELERKRLAEQRAAELDLFAARIAHDLKNPLAAAVLQLGMAEDAVAAPNLKTRIARAQRGVRRAIAIMDEILALARAGGRSEPGAHVSLHEVIDSVVADSLADAERAGARLVVEPFADLEVACGEAPMVSVIANLVRNAVKYITHSAAHERWIRVRAERRADRARIEVEDNGPGLPAGAEASVFELFVRGPSHGEPGLGLGLATVRRIVVAHGGEVGVRSTEGVGSCFWLELPLAPHELAPLVTH